MFRLMRERPQDEPEVEWLYDTCFAPGRTALSSYRLREGVDPVAELCLMARDEFDAVVAAIRYWPVRVGEAGTPALLLGPEMEKNLRHAMDISDGDWTILWDSGLAIGLWVFAGLGLILPYIVGPLLRRRMKVATGTGGPEGD